MKLLIVAASIAVLSGCSSWQAGTTVSTDWYKIGYNEAQSGYTEKWRGNYHMVSGGTPENFDSQAYANGYQDGLKDTCQQKKCIHQPLVADNE